MPFLQIAQGVLAVLVWLARRQLVRQIAITGATWYAAQKITWHKMKGEMSKMQREAERSAREVRRKVEDELNRSIGKPPPNPFQNASGASVSGLFPPEPAGGGLFSSGGAPMTTQPVRLQPHDPMNPNKGRCQGGVARFVYIEFKDIVSAYTPIKEDDKV